jgi:hypothetical protein
VGTVIERDYNECLNGYDESDTFESSVETQTSIALSSSTTNDFIEQLIDNGVDMSM